MKFTPEFVHQTPQPADALAVAYLPALSRSLDTEVVACRCENKGRLRTFGSSAFGFRFNEDPEGHNVHHQRDVHAFNYGDIALWDLVFGTFKNPHAIDVRVGFYDGASNRVGALLCGRDIAATTRSAEASRGPMLTPRTAP